MAPRYSAGTMMWLLTQGSSHEIDMGGIGKMGRVVDRDRLAIVESESIDDTGRSRDDIEIEFALESVQRRFQDAEVRKIRSEIQTLGPCCFLVRHGAQSR